MKIIHETSKSKENRAGYLTKAERKERARKKKEERRKRRELTKFWRSVDVYDGPPVKRYHDASGSELMRKLLTYHLTHEAPAGPETGPNGDFVVGCLK